MNSAFGRWAPEQRVSLAAAQAFVAVPGAEDAAAINRIHALGKAQLASGCGLAPIVLRACLDNDDLVIFPDEEMLDAGKQRKGTKDTTFVVPLVFRSGAGDSLLRVYGL